MAADVFVRAGRSIRSAARDLGVDESTLRYRLGRHRDGVVDGRSRQPEACSAYSEEISAWIREQSSRRRPEPIRSLYELLVSERGYEGSYKSVVRYVNRRRTAPKLRPRRRVEVRPGSQAQVDWAERKVRLWGEGLVTLYAFVMILSFSRMYRIVWSRRQAMLSWLRCHNEAFASLGGVAWTTRIDNLATGVASGAGPTAVVHPVYASYAEQMGFVVDPARVRRPTDKGKVERRIREVDRLDLDRRVFRDLEDLQRVTDEQVMASAARYRNPLTGTSYLDSWRLERESLGPLPDSLPAPFDKEVVSTVPEDGLVWFEGREYHVPFAYTGRDVRLRGCADQVEIYCDRRLVARYERGTTCRRLIRQDFYEGESTDRVEAPVPLGHIGRQIVLERSWEATVRPIDAYAFLVESSR